MKLPTKLPPAISALLQPRREPRGLGPLGIDIGSQGFRLVQLRRQGESLLVGASRYVPFPEDMDPGCDRALSDLLRKSLRRHGFRGREAVSCLRDSDTRIFMINYLLTADMDDDALIAQRMDSRLDGELSDYVIDYMLVRPEGGVAQERSALVAVAENEKVIRQLEILRRAGLNVTAIVLSGPAADWAGGSNNIQLWATTARK